MNVVFTGPAIDNFGRRITRQNLVSACIEHGGLLVQLAVRDDTDIIVASRSDTVKAKAAAARGKVVMTYPQFVTAFLRGVTIKTEGDMNKWTDLGKMDPELMLPVFDPDMEILPLLPA
jgi:hypothetical protein